MKVKTKELSVPQDSILYVGVSEQVAKLAPIKGLEAPVVLTDIYPGYFCLQSLDKDTKWGIVSVSVANLHKDMFAPFSFDKKKSKSKETWQDTLANLGVCLYTANISKIAIEKVTIYQPFGREGNAIINKLIAEQDPREHKSNYEKDLCINRWLNGGEINCSDIFNGSTNYKLIAETEGKLTNRSGLDIYYTKPEEKVRKSHKSAAKERIFNED
jgi:hypothetical protein